MGTQPRRRKPRPVVVYGGVALLLALAGTVGLWYGLSNHEFWHWQPWLGSWLVSINVTAFAYYGLDKARAGSNPNSPTAGRRRVPEVVLHGLALLGGSIGAYLGMRVFHHKTLKGTFRIMFWLIVVLQVLLIALVVRELWFRHPSW
jgi:uncharacterized membrane protein YsdA (DUF1294 family)